MSRVGKLPIPITNGVMIAFDNMTLKVKGPKGELVQNIVPEIKLSVQEEKIIVSRLDDERRSKSLHGLFRVLISNMVIGVTQGFEKRLEVEGIGYRVELKNNFIVLNLGYSHPINFPLPSGITAKVDKQVITIEGADKYLVGEVAARLRSFRKPEPYKGKGVRYAGERIKRKIGKKGVR